MNSLFLVEQGLHPLPILYLSRYIIAHQVDYYRLLLAVTREAAWVPWLLYMFVQPKLLTLLTQDTNSVEPYPATSSKSGTASST